jgi:hypothetical protein
MKHLFSVSTRPAAGHLFVRAPFEKASLLVRAEIVKGASHDKVATPCAIGPDMKVLFIRADVVVAACPKDVSGSVDDRAFSSVVMPHQNIEA